MGLGVGVRVCRSEGPIMFFFFPLSRVIWVLDDW